MSEFDKLGQRVGTVLDFGAQNLSKRVANRLHENRQAALARQRVPVAALSLAGIGNVASHTVAEHFRGILAVAALVAGAMIANSHWQGGVDPNSDSGDQLNFAMATEHAEIDSALLADEVPFAAYTDQGFLAWLDNLAQEEDSSPQ